MDSNDCTQNKDDLGGIIAIMASIFFVTGCTLPAYPVFALVWLIATHTILAIYFAFSCD